MRICQVDFLCFFSKYYFFSMLFRNGIRRAHRTERTALAPGTAGGAVLAAEQHQPMAEIGRLRRVEQLSQGVLHLDRVLLVLDEAQPVGQTDAVRIAHNGRFAENIPEDEVGGLAADAGSLSSSSMVSGTLPP